MHFDNTVTHQSSELQATCDDALSRFLLWVHLLFLRQTYYPNLLINIILNNNKIVNVSKSPYNIRPDIALGVSKGAQQGQITSTLKHSRIHNRHLQPHLMNRIL